MGRWRHLLTSDLWRLDQACRPIEQAFGDEWTTYLVGSVEQGKEYRDVDVRTILPDEEFDAVFGERPLLWDAFCLGQTAWLTQQTGLPIDYQVQRATEANEKHAGKPRNPLGRARGRRFAGGGDATPPSQAVSA